MLSISGKVRANILLGWLKPVIEPSFLEEQCGFLPQRGTIDQIWVLRQVIEKAIEHRSNIHICFVDLSKAFDSVPRHALTKILKDSGTEDEVVRLIVDLHDGTGCIVRDRGKSLQGLKKPQVSVKGV